MNPCGDTIEIRSACSRKLFVLWSLGVEYQSASSGAVDCAKPPVAARARRQSADTARRMANVMRAMRDSSDVRTRETGLYRLGLGRGAWKQKGQPDRWPSASGVPLPPYASGELRQTSAGA